MATWHNRITPEQADLIGRSRLFFVASADPSLDRGSAAAGPVNVSPKGGVPLHVLSPNRVAYLDFAGSGNETARHAAAGGPITVMVCSFEQDDAAIVRLYGSADVQPIENSPLAGRLLAPSAGELNLPPRQVIEVIVEKTVTSCGYGVPVMEFVRERETGDRGRRYKRDEKAVRAAVDAKAETSNPAWQGGQEHDGENG